MSGSALEQGFPPPVSADIGAGDLRSYWYARAEQHTQDSYAGVTLCKFPEDLRTYEHLLWALSPDTVIELGTFQGASALWFRDRLRTLRGYGRIERAPQVISIDLDQAPARAALAAADPSFGEEIELVEADVADPGLPDRVAAILRPGARCFVIEDSAHVFETTRAALEGFARFVPPGGFFVVEDGCVDVEEMRLPGRDWPRGVLPALDAWLASPAGSEFVLRRDLELYGLSCHPRGFLQRRGG
jgi:cephalosporin hydroxylase